MINFWSKNLFLLCSMIFSLLIFVFLSVQLLTKSKIIHYDEIIADLFNDIAVNHSDYFAVFITNFGDPRTVSVLLVITILLLMMRKYFKESLFLFFTTISGFTLTFLLKRIFERLRPEDVIPLVHTMGYSFPSGHAASATCFYGALIYLAFIFIKTKNLKIASICFLGLLILLIGLSRIYLGAHYPTDVLGGFSLGIFVVSVWVLVYKVMLSKLPH